jgi:putative ABC transport system permease protein
MGYIFHNFLNTLKHYKVSSLLNILGMTVAFAAFYVIMTQVSYNFSYNKGLKDVDQLYVLTTPSSYQGGEYETYLSRPIGETIIDEAPGVEIGGLTNLIADQANFFLEDAEGNLRRIDCSLHQMSVSGFQTFSPELISGKIEDLNDTHNLFISESFARKHSLELGDKIYYRNSKDAVQTVVGVYKDFPRASDLSQADVIEGVGDRSLDDFSEWSYCYTVKLRKDADIAQFEESALKSVEKVALGAGVDAESMEEVLNECRVHLIPFKDVYYSKDLRNPVGLRGNRTSDIAMLSVAILIILIAMINFLNFFFAMVPVRLKSVNTYKIFGVSRSALVWNFLMEAVGLVVISLFFAALVVWGFLNTSMDGFLTSSALPGDNLGILGLTAVVALAAAAAGSIYPALYITSFQPALALKGNFGFSASGRRLRTLLIGLQFVISTALIICAIFIKLQHSYMITYDMGFDKEQLYCADIQTPLAWNKGPNEAFEARLKSSPLVQDIAWADGDLVAAARMGWGRTYNGQKINFQCYPVSYNFLKFMGIEIVEGRDFLPSDEHAENGTMIFNREAQKQFGIDIEKPGPGHKGDNAVVAGICKDFNFQPLQYGKSPFAFYVFGQDSWREALRHMYLRASAGAKPSEVIKLIKDTVLEFAPNVNPDLIKVQLFDTELGSRYEKEQNLANMISILTLIAIIISLMGVFGLVLFETQHRSKEIAVRRVLGAKISDILKMLNAKFIAIVLVCFAIAAPLSIVIMRRYLSGYAYHTALSWWVFAAALLAVLCLTVGIVTLRSWSAATANPVEKLKNE